MQDGKERVIAYGSKSLSKEERKYCVTRRELLAVVHFVKQYRHYLYGKSFLVRTDHGALKYLLNFKDPQGQMARWLQVLDTYDFRIEHRAGRSHNNADAMSRGPCKQCGDETCSVRVVTRGQLKQGQDTGPQGDLGSTPHPVAPPTGQPPRRKARRGGDEVGLPITPPTNTQTETLAEESWLKHDELSLEALREAQHSDRVIGTMTPLIEKGVKPKWDEVTAQGNEFKALWSQWESLQVGTDGLLYRVLEGPGTKTRKQLVIPRKLVEPILDMVPVSYTHLTLPTKA